MFKQKSVTEQLDGTTVTTDTNLAERDKIHDNWWWQSQSLSQNKTWLWDSSNSNGIRYRTLIILTRCLINDTQKSTSRCRNWANIGPPWSTMTRRYEYNARANSAGHLSSQDLPHNTVKQHKWWTSIGIVV